MAKVCIIEDDESIRDILRIVLENGGYEVEMYADGQCILQRTCPVPDLFLLDKQLQGFDGLNLCEFLRLNEATRDVPVVMMSAYPNVGELALRAGANAFIEKPFAITALLNTIGAQIHHTALAVTR